MILLAVTLISLSAFAESYSYTGTLSILDGNLGIQTADNGFIAVDMNVISGKLGEEVIRCLNKPVKAFVEDRGMLSDLISISCE